MADDQQQHEQQRRSRRLRAEAELYAPVKRFLQARGLDAKGEVRGCDVVAISPAALELPVVVELKRTVPAAEADIAAPALPPAAVNGSASRSVNGP